MAQRTIGGHMISHVACIRCEAQGRCNLQRSSITRLRMSTRVAQLRCIVQKARKVEERCMRVPRTFHLKNGSISVWHIFTPNMHHYFSSISSFCYCSSHRVRSPDYMFSTPKSLPLHLTWTLSRHQPIRRWHCHLCHLCRLASVRSD